MPQLAPGVFVDMVLVAFDKVYVQQNDRNVKGDIIMFISERAIMRGRDAVNQPDKANSVVTTELQPDLIKSCV